MNGSGDIVILRTPRGDKALPALRVVIGGIASLQSLSVDCLDDIELAVEALVADEPAEAGELVLTVSASGGNIVVRLDGLANQKVRAALLADDTSRPDKEWLPDVRVLLDSLVDRYLVLEPSEGRFAVEMEKRVS